LGVRHLQRPMARGTGHAVKLESCHRGCAGSHC
jgi:hypothetical protein